MKKFVWGLSALMAFAWMGCSDDGTDPDPDPGTGTGGTGTETEYEIPTYNDDYTSTGDDIASWSSRGLWNLANVHDPSVAYYDGYYYMYNTDASYGNEHEGHGHFQGKKSTDLVNWEWVGGPFYDPPTWIADSLNAIRGRMGLAEIAEANISYGYWAPVVRKVTVGGQEKLRMYYSVVIDNFIKTGAVNTSANFDGSWTERAFIGMCESTDPAGAVWEDKGYVTCSSSDLGLDYSRSSYTNDWNGYFYYNAIDPTYIVTSAGEHYLIHGSWHSGFTILEVDATTGKPLNDLGEPYAFSVSELTSRYGKRIATRTSGSRWQGSEAPEIVYKDGYYYLFMAYDGLDVPYNTRVCRSTSIDGPYYGSDGANVTEGADCFPVITHPYQFNNHSGWVGIAHCAVFQSEDGDWFYASQGRLPAGTNGNAYANANMMGHIRKIRWTNDGWPVVMPERYTGVPEEEVTDDELVGSWECITLRYSYGNMQTSEDLTLNSDGTATGAISGNWSYNSSTNMLTIGSISLCVEREVNWEADPREVTIVFSGLTSDKKYSLWGKKVD